MLYYQRLRLNLTRKMLKKRLLPVLGKITVGKLEKSCWKMLTWSLLQVIWGTRMKLKRMEIMQKLYSNSVTRLFASMLWNLLNWGGVKDTMFSNFNYWSTLIFRLFRYRLLTNQCQNQGFILDGFPETREQARLLLLTGNEGGEYYGEEPGEDGKDMMDSRLVPGFNFSFI